jgi:hypothetical protein
LFYAFGDEESADDVDPREIALFTLFLASVGWTEDEFWQASEEAGEMCPDCEKEKEKEKEKEQEEVLPVIAKKPDTSKAN